MHAYSATKMNYDETVKKLTAEVIEVLNERAQLISEVLRLRAALRQIDHPIAKAALAKCTPWACNPHCNGECKRDA